MKKFLFTLALIMGVITANAQKTLEIPNTIFDNTYIGVGAGVFTPLQLTEVFPLNATATLRVGKELNPVVALELEGTAAFGSHTSHDGRYSWHQIVRATNLGLNGTVNLSNLFFGYNGDNRKFELLTVTGFGWGHGFVNKAYGKDVNSLTAKTGLEARVRVADGLSLVAQPAVIWGLTGEGSKGVKFNSNRAQLGITVGLVYRFKNSNGTHSWGPVYDVAALNDEINSLRAQLAEKPTEVEKVVKEVVKEEVPVEVFKFVPNEWVLSFEKAKATLTDEAKAKLDAIPTDFTVKIVGKASPEGSSAFNKKLSQDRADAVSNYLTNKGVKVDSSVGVGVENNASQRVAIITIVE